MKHARERTLLAIVLLGVPGAFYLAVARPVAARIDRLVEARKAAEAAFAGPMPYIPVSAEERTRLQDPAAAWRRRIPVVQGDQARLLHYHAVVSELQRLWREGGAPAATLRSSWDPIRASFTLPTGLPGVSSADASLLDQPERRVEGWVIEARFEGGPERLFRALSLTPKAVPLVEPVGFRWEGQPDGTQKQFLALRNLTLGP